MPTHEANLHSVKILEW